MVEEPIDDEYNPQPMVSFISFMYFYQSSCDYALKIVIGWCQIIVISLFDIILYISMFKVWR